MHQIHSCISGSNLHQNQLSEIDPPFSDAKKRKISFDHQKIVGAESHLARTVALMSIESTRGNLEKSSRDWSRSRIYISQWTWENRKSKRNLRKMKHRRKMLLALGLKICLIPKKNRLKKIFFLQFNRLETLILTLSCGWATAVFAYFIPYLPLVWFLELAEG